MVLVAAAAAGFGVARTVLLEEHYWTTFAEGLSWLHNVRRLVASLAITFALALMLLRLRRPRPDLRAIGAQPGFAGCVAVVVEAFFHAISAEARIVWSGRYPPDASWFMPVLLHHATLAPVVAAVWIVLAISGRWASEPSWIDRAGRVLGFLVLGSCLAFSILDRTPS